jgi:hypothetical protein
LYQTHVTSCALAVEGSIAAQAAAASMPIESLFSVFLPSMIFSFFRFTEFPNKDSSVRTPCLSAAADSSEQAA